VKFYATERGFGFITCDSNGRDVFVHASVLRRAGIIELTPGQSVSIMVAEAPKGPEATSVRLA
jgi:CspA family cold shock protein